MPYYDFSKIKNNYDCTNFVSHALLAGGAKPYKPSGATGIIGTGWYYTNLDNRSSSWSGVSYLYSFLTSNRKKDQVVQHRYTLQMAALKKSVRYYNSVMAPSGCIRQLLPDLETVQPLRKIML